MKSPVSRALACLLAVGLLAGTASAVTIKTVPVGNPGNAPGTWGAGYGDVNYMYNIGKHEVTTAQYTEFLNKVAAADLYGLYNTNMWVSPYGCKIQRTGSPGSYTYSVTAGWANRPVTYVSWGDSIRFANWLHNGQPTGAQSAGTTETGAYTLNGAMTSAELLSVTRNAGWKWAVPTEDEWYKAAYHKNDGVTGNYWLSPLNSDHIDTTMANYHLSVDDTTEVGAYPYPSPYGTFDQGGNVWEWNEAVIDDSYRGLRGGAFDDNGYYLLALDRYDTFDSSGEVDNLGFRVVEVPEPMSLALLAFGGVGMLFGRRRPGR